MTPASGFARMWASVAAVLAVMLGIAVASDFEPTAAAPVSAAPAAPALDVTLTEFAVEPAELTVAAGAPFEVRVTNEGTIPHDFVITGVGATPLLQAGESAVLAVEALEPGAYEILCAEAGHESAGMHAVLQVSADPQGGVDSGSGGHAGAHMTAEEMAAQHEALGGFPAATDGVGNQPLAPEIADDGAKVFELTADEIAWETEPGVVHEAMAFNGQIPGPRIDIDLGDHVRVVVRNELSVPTALHLHGVLLPNEMDGVPGVTQPSIMPGETFTYEFVARNSGSHMYHSHFDSANQVPGGLLGAFIIHGPDEPAVDHDYVMVLNDGPLGYTLNGKSFPGTSPLVVKQGETVRVRYMNEGLQVHPMHLHGVAQEIIAEDGYPLAAPLTQDNILVAPGDRVDVIVKASEPGTWAWHCHILSHAEGPDGMFGMVTAMVVE